MTLLPLLTTVLVVVILVMAIWLYATMDQSKDFLRDQLEERNLTILRQEKEIARLTTIIASKDPMTFQVLSVPQTTSLNSDPESAYITEEEEARRWAIATGKLDADGEVEDISDDLRMLGLT